MGVRDMRIPRGHSFVVALAIFAWYLLPGAPIRAQAGLDRETRNLVGRVMQGSTAVGYPALYTKSDFLPAWCDYTSDGKTKDEGKIVSYFQSFGGAFIHMHHYCRGLFAQHEAKLNWKDESKKLFDLRQAVSEYDYVLSHADTGFRLRPEILVRKGLALLEQDESLDAVTAFQQAIEQQRNYVPAYVALANYFRRVGDDSEARRILETGVAAVPRSELLQTKLEELNGSED
jgi:tetratricopeptide (TPR) repeat protein